MCYLGAYLQLDTSKKFFEIFTCRQFRAQILIRVKLNSII